MSDLINIEKELVRLGGALDLLTTDFEGLCRRAADARSDYDIAWAKALLKSNGSAKDIRESEAVQVVETEMREARIAEAIRDAAKERIRALESLLTVHQSRLKWLDEGKRFA